MERQRNGSGMCENGNQRIEGSNVAVNIDWNHRDKTLDSRLDTECEGTKPTDEP